MPLNKIFFVLLFSSIFNGCTEPYILETNTYEEALIVQATITNEFKTQEITLTKSSRFEDKETQIESDAEVFIIDNTGYRYDFKEESGKYISRTEFQIAPDKEYRLNIITKDGRFFESTPERLPTLNPMQDVTAKVETDENMGRGVAIKVKSFDAANQSKYYRYEYEENYKIVTPKWSTKVAFVPDFGIGEYPKIILFPNSPDTKVCYGTKKNTDIILVNTNEFKEDRVDFPVRFISDQNYIISHRYSIEVRQYVESLAAFTFYQALKKISGSGSIFSPLQPGIINSNIKSTDTDNKVIGYFDVTSVSTKRIYFNYVDLFPGAILPPYYTDCTKQELIFCFDGEKCGGDILAYGFSSKQMSYYENSGSLYTVYPYPCGDCTSFSSNIKPPFWED